MSLSESPSTLPQSQSEEVTEVVRASQLSFFSTALFAHRRILAPAPKAIPAKIDGDWIDPDDGDVLTIQYQVKVNGSKTQTPFREIKQSTNLVRSHRRELDYLAQFVTGSAVIVAQHRPED